MPAGPLLRLKSARHCPTSVERAERLDSGPCSRKAEVDAALALRPLEEDNMKKITMMLLAALSSGTVFAAAHTAAPTAAKPPTVQPVPAKSAWTRRRRRPVGHEKAPYGIPLRYAGH